MSLALRGLVLLAATVPLFAATAFRPAWWQILLAAVVGSAVGHVVVRVTRGRRVAEWTVAIVAVAVVAVFTVALSGGSFTRAARDDSSRFLIVRSSEGTSSLTWDDVQAIRSEIPSIDLAVPYLQQSVQLASEATNWNTLVIGTTPDYFDLMVVNVAAGARFDASKSDKVVVVGETVATQLFGASKRAVGEIVRIQNQPFTIIGLLAHRGMSPGGQDLDDMVLIPIEVYTAKIDRGLGARFRGAVLISARPEDLARVEAALRSLLRERHRLAAGADDDFVIRTSKPG